VSEVLTKTLLAGDRASLGCRDDVLANRVGLLRKRVQVLAKGIVLRQILGPRGRDYAVAVH